MDFIKFIREADEDKRDRDRLTGVTEPVKTALEKRKEDSKNLADFQASIGQRNQDTRVNTNPQYTDKPNTQPTQQVKPADKFQSKPRSFDNFKSDVEDLPQYTVESGREMARKLVEGREGTDDIDHTLRFDEILDELNNNYDNILSDLRPGQRAKRNQFESKKKLIESVYKRMGKIDPKDQDSFKRSIIMASLFDQPGKRATGDITFNDLSAARDNKDRVLSVYGDGSMDHLRGENGIRNFRPFFENLDDETLDEFLNIVKEVAPKLHTNLGKGGSKEAGQDFSEYFLGRDEEGNAIRGGLRTEQNKDQRRHVLGRILLQQGGFDPITGMPLDLSKMSLDHFTPAQGEGGQAGEFLVDREDEDNFVWLNHNINKRKAARTIPDFYDKVIDKDYNKMLELGDENDPLAVRMAELKEEEQWVPNTYQMFADLMMSGEEEEAAIQRANNAGEDFEGADGGKMRIKYLNDKITSNLLRQSFTEGEKIGESYRKMKDQIIDSWEEENITEELEKWDRENNPDGIELNRTKKKERDKVESAVKKKSKTMRNQNQKDVKAMKIAREMLRDMGFKPNFDDKKYWRRDNIPYTAKARDLYGDQNNNHTGLGNATLMSMVKKVEAAESPEEKKQIQKDHIQSIEDCKNTVHNIMMPGKSNKRVKLRNGRSVARGGRGATGSEPYKRSSTQAFSLCLHSKGMLDEDEIKRSWDYNPKEMIELRHLIDHDSNDNYSIEDINNVFEELIDED